MSAARRLQLLDWARASGAWILEDDYDSEYRYESQPIASLQGLDRDARVVYIGTLQQDPLPRRCASATSSFRATSCPASPPSATRWTSSRPPRRKPCWRTSSPRATSRATCAARGSSTASAAARWSRPCAGSWARRCEVLGDRAGMHLVAALAKGTRDRALAERAALQGLWTMPLSSCYLGTARPGLVLGYGGTDVSEILDGVRRLRRVLEED